MHFELISEIAVGGFDVGRYTGMKLVGSGE